MLYESEQCWPNLLSYPESRDHPDRRGSCLGFHSFCAGTKKIATAHAVAASRPTTVTPPAWEHHRPARSSPLTTASSPEIAGTPASSGCYVIPSLQAVKLTLMEDAPAVQ